MSEQNEPQNDAQIPQEKEPSSFRLVMTLVIAGFISGAAIIGIYISTLPTITENKARELKEAVFKVLPGAARMEKFQYEAKKGDSGTIRVRTEKGKDDNTLYGAYDANEQFIGYALPGAGPGFQDTISLLYGYLPEKRKVVGMEILESRETPGLGDKIYKDAYFVSNFHDLSIDPEIVVVKKGLRDEPHEVDSITGATISAKAVVRIINQANERWLEKLPLTPP